MPLSDDEIDEIFVVSTAEACRMTGWTAQKLWRMAKAGKLSPPRRLSARRCLWRQRELEALGFKRLPPPDRYTFSRAGAARWLKVCPETVSRLVAAGTLPAQRKKGRLFFRPEDLSAAKEQRRNDERLDWEETAALLGISYVDLYTLWKRKFFIPTQTNLRKGFRRGDVLAWYAHYLETGSLTGNPVLDAKFKHIKPIIKNAIDLRSLKNLQRSEKEKA